MLSTIWSPGYQTEEIDLKTYKEELKESVLKGEEKGLVKHLLFVSAFTSRV